MPTNVTPEYRRIEAAYRQASDPREKLGHLKAMLSAIPKHKGTEHLQAEIKSRIKQLTEELSAPKKGKRSGPLQVVHPEGAAQIALLGAPNTGKSALHARLCGSQATVGPYPFSTVEPLPGMLPFEDVHFQLVDLPPLTREHPLPWIVNALQPADGALLVVDLTAEDCVDATAEVLGILADRRVRLTPDWRRRAIDEDDDALEPFGRLLATLVVVSKCDLLEDPAGEVAVFFDLLGERFPWLAASAETGAGTGAIGEWLFRELEVVRVYTKTPGKAPETEKPFTVRRGQTVRDVARLVHQELEERIRFARIWGSETFEGQQVGPEHVVADGDVVEIHA